MQHICKAARLRVSQANLMRLSRARKAPMRKSAPATICTVQQLGEHNDIHMCATQHRHAVQARQLWKKLPEGADVPPRCSRVCSA